MRHIEIKCTNKNCSKYNIVHNLELYQCIFKVWDVDLHQMRVYNDILDGSQLERLQCMECFYMLDCVVKDKL